MTPARALQAGKPTLCSFVKERGWIKKNDVLSVLNSAVLSQFLCVIRHYTTATVISTNAAKKAFLADNVGIFKQNQVYCCLKVRLVNF